LEIAMSVLEYEGSNFLRQRLILSTLSGKPVKIKKIRSSDENPGLHEFEANLLSLLDRLTNGTKIDISVTGTTLLYRPGILIGGTLDHDCNLERSIGYYLEVIICLAPFCKQAVSCTLTGITNDHADPTVDFLKGTNLPLMKLFGVGDDLELKINKRGASPGGGGEIYFHCPRVNKLRTLNFTEPGKVKNIRGVAYATRVSPQMPNRLVTSARGVLNGFIPDIYINTDHLKGAQSGKSPGFGIYLEARSTKDVILSAECNSLPKSENASVDPEELGKRAACALLEEIHSGGCVGSSSQYLAALFMALGEQDVGKVLFGPLTPYTIEFLRHIRDFLQVTFKLEAKTYSGDQMGQNIGSSKVLLTCVGVGFSNMSKTIR
uniref:RNA 3'-terminal phosphate cyclase-like protein n=2 Tax=Ciona intestinalis TaxID=7719 RepID=H2XT24_CIOIN